MNSFEIILKNDRSEIEILATRALLAIAGVAAFVYADELNYYVGLVLSVLLLLSSFFVKTILDRFKVNRLFLFGLAAVFTYLTTHSIAFALILLIYGLFFYMLKRKVKVELADTGIIIHYVFYMRPIQWNALNNVILKDRILTIDFKSDKLMQSEIAPESFGVDENLFNGFCMEQLQNKS